MAKNVQKLEVFNYNAISFKLVANSLPQTLTFNYVARRLFWFGQRDDFIHKVIKSTSLQGWKKNHEEQLKTWLKNSETKY